MAITRTALGRNGFRGGIDVRVSMREDAGGGDSAFDGARWQRGRDLTVELPELIAELGRRGVRGERFASSLDRRLGHVDPFRSSRDPWEAVPRKISVLGRVIRTGGFRSMDPQVVCLT